MIPPHNPAQQKGKVEGANLGLAGLLSCWGAAELQLQASFYCGCVP